MQAGDARWKPTLWRHDGTRWASAPDERGPAPTRLTVVTWNVWFGEWERRARWSALMAEVAACRPDVIALQEVTPAMLSMLVELDWLQAGYAISDVDGATFDAHYGVWLASRVPVRGLSMQTLPSQMGRALLTADLGTLTVSTVHLESLRQSGPARAEQLSRIDGWLDGSRPRVLVGDMNFDDGAAERSRLGSDWRDAVGPDQRGPAAYTIDSDINFMHDVVHGSGDGSSHKRVRYDRAFVRGTAVRATQVRRLGTSPLPDDPLTFPSDHFGLCIELAVRPDADAHDER